MFCQLIISCFEKTSVKGIPRIIKHETLGLRILWFLSVSCLMIVAAINLYVVAMRYLQYSTSTKISEKHLVEIAMDRDRLMELPTISVCNLNPLPSDEGAARKHHITTWSTYSQTMQAETIKFVEQKEKEGFDVKEDVDLVQSLSYLLSYRGYFQHIGTHNASLVGHSKDNLIISCAILVHVSATERKRVPCNQSIITRFVTPEFFNCRSIRIAHDKPTLLSGMSFILHVDQAHDRLTDFFDNSNDNLQSTGVKFNIHRRQELPNMLDKSFDASPGYMTDVLIKIIEMLRLGHPYGACVEDTLSTYCFDLEGNDIAYSPEACINVCLQENIVSVCDCFDPDLIVTKNLSDINLNFCGSYTGNLSATLQKLSCVGKIKTESNVSMACILSCKPRCFDIEKRLTISLAKWPQLSQQLSFFWHMVKDNEEIMKKEYSVYAEAMRMMSDGNTSAAKKIMQDDHLIENNFLKMRFLLKGTSVTFLEEEPAITFSTMLCLLGGILNLYSGVSLVVAVEILELFYHLLLHMTTPIQTNQTKVSPM